MQTDKMTYTLNYPIDKVWNKIYETRKKVVYRHEKLIEVWLKEKKFEKLEYFLEDKSQKITMKIDFIEKDNTTILDIFCEIKSRSIVKDIFLYLSINVKKEINEYIKQVEKELENEI
ncbi:hypothetical protein [Oceanivirga salmonicida]|uniref:hypothetical protein n=1 Tax=Oceanivirga salmonicida TaxID=1769291 RepID=UPI0008327ED5|nr:hypothetical protein [Oceanivirga salmonicida]